MDERITSMIPQYGELNRIYTDILSGKGFSFEKQKFISDFYRQQDVGTHRAHEPSEKCG